MINQPDQGASKEAMDTRCSFVGTCLVSALFYAIAGMVVKLAANDEANFPATELTAARAAMQLVVAVVGLLKEGAPAIPPNRARKWVWLQGILFAIGSNLYFHTVTCLPLGGALAITSLYPIAASMFARVLLKEKVSWGQGAALVLSTAGIVFLCQPGFIFGSASATRHLNRLFWGAQFL
jgi:drug/metabolite transporter (DMT)-like permease